MVILVSMGRGGGHERHELLVEFGAVEIFLHFSERAVEGRLVAGIVGEGIAVGGAAVERNIEIHLL